MNMTKLSINLNKFALLRNARGTNYPNVESMGRRALAVGAHGITVHPRPDQRHIRYDDVPVLSSLCAAHTDIEFNIEGNPEDDFMELVLAAKPEQCTLVPDDPNQLTSDHGWNLQGDTESLCEKIAILKAENIRVCLFMDPDPEQITRVAATGADRIELYTEAYARHYGSEKSNDTLEQYRLAAECAHQCKIGVNAGHDLNLQNLGTFLNVVPSVEEVSIGHAIIVESFDHGFEATLKKYLTIVNQSAP